ncbi:hypothetical protein BGW80DRAFT_1173296 [Lactifluus volemus]|nr:hypothetical protein BGW80DRAFT_1173296 [Lactifluus volemus]
MRRHLYDHHLDLWVPACDKLNISITAKEAQARVAEYRQRHGQTCPTDMTQPETRRKFSSKAFVDAIMEFIVADDQSINVIESPQLRAIFLMLRDDLQDKDIPHRTTIRNRILEVWDTYLETLANEMQVNLRFNIYVALRFMV